jgi:hypothetical protein
MDWRLDWSVWFDMNINTRDVGYRSNIIGESQLSGE